MSGKINVELEKVVSNKFKKFTNGELTLWLRRHTESVLDDAFRAATEEADYRMGVLLYDVWHVETQLGKDTLRSRGDYIINPNLNNSDAQEVAMARKVAELPYDRSEFWNFEVYLVGQKPTHPSDGSSNPLAPGFESYQANLELVPTLRSENSGIIQNNAISWAHFEHTLNVLLPENSSETLTILAEPLISSLRSNIIGLMGIKLYKDTNEVFKENILTFLYDTLSELKKLIPEKGTAIRTIRSFIDANLA